MARDDGGERESERSLMTRRSKGSRVVSRASKGRAGTPANRGEGQSARVPSALAGVRHSGDDPQDSRIIDLQPTSTTLTPIDGTPEELSHYKGVSLKNVGRDVRGRVIPHKRQEKLAKQIMVWVAGGFNVNDIAIRINVRPGLIKQNYGKELATGETEVHMDVHNHLLTRVKKSDRMAIFYAKARMGYRDGDTKAVDTGVLNINIHL